MLKSNAKNLVVTALLALIPCVGWSASRMTAYPAQRFSMKGIRDIQIIGVKGRVTLRGQSRAKLMSFRVRHSSQKKFEDWQLAMDRRGDTLYIEVLSLVYGKKWRSHLRANQWPEFDIELIGPARPTVVSWREGNLEFINWDANLDVTFLRGKTKIKGGKGDLVIHPMQANIEFSNRIGDIAVRGESGDLSFQENVGKLNLNWFKGKLDLVECHGELNIESQDSVVRVKGGQGKLVVNLPKGHADLFGFKGHIQAMGQEASWGIRSSAPYEVNLTSKSGAVDISWFGGAKVFLTSTDGEIKAGNVDFLHPAIRDGRKVHVGRKPGKLSGDVFVRTQSGSIVWR